jgi:hypothetical protein
VLRGKFIGLSAYIKKTETSQVNNLMLHLKLLEKRRTNQAQNQKMERNNKDQGRDQNQQMERNNKDQGRDQ